MTTRECSIAILTLAIAQAYLYAIYFALDIRNNNYSCVCPFCTPRRSRVRWPRRIAPRWLSWFVRHNWGTKVELSQWDGVKVNEQCHVVEVFSRAQPPRYSQALATDTCRSLAMCLTFSIYSNVVFVVRFCVLCGVYS